MMDPIAALGLAGNIVQFVDFSCKILSETKNIYGSSSGASADNDVLEAISSDLMNLNNALTAPSAIGAIPDSTRVLASRCKDVAAELLLTLDKLKVSGPPRKWKSFVQALRSVWKKEQIENLVRRMESLRNEIQHHLLFMLSEGQSETQQMLESLIDENRRMRLDGPQQLESLIKSVYGVISQLQAETKHRIEAPQAKLQTDQRLTSGDSAAMTPSWEDMKELSDNVSSLANEVRLSASNQMLLKSLWFDYMHKRQATVEPAYEKTFGWVLDSSSPVEFVDWARSQNGIYWIMGKAGSGKSTLMKFLLDHPQATESLKYWAGTKELVIVSFFFWNAGSSLQKSQEGLFRSLLCKILSQCPDLIRTVCASKAKTFRPFVGEVEPWTQQELWHAIGRLKEQSGVRARFCFFIDGLDEYDGDADHIVSVLESLRSWQDVKLCVSSRPWNEFADAFGRPSDPQLALVDLTREDVRIYVRDTLEENSRFMALSARDDRSQDLVLEIVDKARGVFLWVRLVVRSLLTGLTNADRIFDLQKRLQEFPETLEKYFANMIASVEPVYREQTAQMFKYALEADRPLSSMTYSFLDEEDLDDVLAAPVNVLTTEEILSRQDDMRRRLNGRCKGLLEVVYSETPEYEMLHSLYIKQFHLPKVEFLHRTVRDFLHTKDMQDMLDKNLKDDFEPKLRFCKALLAQMKALDYRALSRERIVPAGAFLESLLEDMVFYAGQLEWENRVPQTKLLDEAGKCLSKYAEFLGWKEGSNDYLIFLVQRRLPLYITEKLTMTTQLSQSYRSILLGSILDSKGAVLTVKVYDMQMIDILLENGAQPNDRYKDSTVWGSFLCSVRSDAIYLNRNDDEVLSIVQSLLSHGANLQQRIVTGQETKTRKLTGRSADLHKREEFKVDIIETAHQLLLKKFGEGKISEVVEKARKDNKANPQKLRWWSGRSFRASLRKLTK